MPLDPIITVAILSGEVNSRQTKILKSIESINNQTYKSLQKILVNGGNPPHQTELLQHLGADLSGWIIIDFPIDTMEIHRGTSTHKWTGQAALNAASGEYFFSMNDDDFLEIDFFEKIVKLFKKYPSAISGMGVPIYYYYDTDTYGSYKIPTDKNGNIRPEYESGLEVTKKIFFEKSQTYQRVIGFQPVSKTSKLRDVSTTFFSHGFPDTSSYFQLVSRGPAVFDSTALMYWGKHSSQHNLRASDRHYWFGSYKEDFTQYSKINCEIFKTYLPSNKSEVKKIKKFYKRLLIFSSLLALNSRFSHKVNKNELDYKSNENYNGEPVKFPVALHLKIVLGGPILASQLIISNLVKRLNH